MSEGSCNCIQRVNEQIADRNIKIATSFQYAESVSEEGKRSARLMQRVIVATEKLDSNKRSNKKPMIVVASYCPFCGIKWGVDGEGEQP